MATSITITGELPKRRWGRAAGTRFDWGQPFVYFVALLAVLAQRRAPGILGQ